MNPEFEFTGIHTLITAPLYTCTKLTKKNFNAQKLASLKIHEKWSTLKGYKNLQKSFRLIENQPWNM